MRTHTFFLKIWRWKNAEMEFVENDMECLGEFQLREKWRRQWSVTKSRGKNWKSFKNCLWNAKHTFFATVTSRQGKPPKHSKSQLWKKFLSVFCGWKVYPRGSCELSRKNLCVPLATRPFTREQVAKNNSRARDCSMRLGRLATESPKQDNTVFENFQFL